MLKVRNYRGELELVSKSVYALVADSSSKWRFRLPGLGNGVAIRERRGRCLRDNPWDPRRWVVCYMGSDGAVQAMSSISFHQGLEGKEGALVRAGLLLETIIQYQEQYQ